MEKNHTGDNIKSNALMLPCSNVMGEERYENSR
jgi:hypothetical protein